MQDPTNYSNTLANFLQEVFPFLTELYQASYMSGNQSCRSQNGQCQRKDFPKGKNVSEIVFQHNLASLMGKHSSLFNMLQLSTLDPSNILAPTICLKKCPFSCYYKYIYQLQQQYYIVCYCTVLCYATVHYFIVWCSSVLFCIDMYVALQ